MMDKINILLGWGITRSALFLIEDEAFMKLFAGINCLTFLVHAADAATSPNFFFPFPSPVRVPNEVLLGLSCFGGSAGASLALVMFQNKRNDAQFQMQHMLISTVQCIALSSVARYQYAYPIQKQIDDAIDEVQFSLDMIWQNLMSRFARNTRQHKPSSLSTKSLFTVICDHFIK